MLRLTGCAVRRVLCAAGPLCKIVGGHLTTCARFGTDEPSDEYIGLNSEGGAEVDDADDDAVSNTNTHASDGAESELGGAPKNISQLAFSLQKKLGEGAAKNSWQKAVLKGQRKSAKKGGLPNSPPQMGAALLAAAAAAVKDGADAGAGAEPSRKFGGKGAWKDAFKKVKLQNQLYPLATGDTGGDGDGDPCVAVHPAHVAFPCAPRP